VQALKESTDDIAMQTNGYTGSAEDSSAVICHDMICGHSRDETGTLMVGGTWAVRSGDNKDTQVGNGNQGIAARVHG